MRGWSRAMGEAFGRALAGALAALAVAVAPAPVAAQRMAPVEPVRPYTPPVTPLGGRDLGTPLTGGVGQAPRLVPDTPAPTLRDVTALPAAALPRDEPAREYKRGLVVPEAELTGDTLALLETDVSQRPRVFASFIDASYPDRERIRTAAGAAAHDIDDVAGLTVLMAAQRGSLFVVIGHSEDGRLVRRRAGDDAATGEIALSDIVQAAQAAGVALYLLTCRAAEAADAPGPRDVVFGHEVIPQIRAAQAAATYGDFLAAFGTADHPSVARGLRQLSDGRVLTTRREPPGQVYEGVLYEPRPVAAAGGGAPPPPPDTGVTPLQALWRVLTTVAGLVAMLAVLFWILRVLIPIRRRQKEDDTP
jgi:hypothetical protein